MTKLIRGSLESLVGLRAPVRRGPLVMRGAALGAAAMALALGGCLDDRGPAGLEAGPARWGLVAQVTAPSQPGDAMRVRLTYARGSEPEGALATVVVPIPTDAAPGSSFSRPLSVDLAPCIGDPEHTPEGNSCSVSAHVVLTRGGVTLDEIVLGPFVLQPGQTAAPQSVTLHEVDRVEVTTPDVGHLYADATLALTGRVLDRDGEVVSDRAVTWTSSAADVAMVDATSGMLTAVAPGTAVISAASGGRTTELTVRVWARPEIRFAPTTVTFDVEQGQPVPAALSVAVSNGTEGDLGGLLLGEIAYEQSEADWLSVALAGDTAPTTLSLQPTRSDLPPGTYGATVPVSGADASNSPASLSVTYTVRAPLLLSLAPVQLTFNAAGAIPAAQSVAVTAGGTVGPVTATVAYASSYEGWLDVAVSGTSTTPTTLTVRPNSASLPTGTYSADVAVAATGARNSPQTLHVTYVVAPVVLNVSPTSLDFTTTGALPAAQTLSVTSTFGTAGPVTASTVYAAGSGSGWLDVAVVGSGNTPRSITVRPNDTQLPAGTYEADVVVVAPGAVNTPATVHVTYTLPPVDVTAAPVSLTFFGGDYYSGLPSAQSVTVGTSRPWPGDALVSGISYISQYSGWLDATISGSGLPGTLAVQPNVVDIQPGRYDAAVRVTVPGTGDTASVAVIYYAGYGLYTYSSDIYLHSPADTLALFADVMAYDESGSLDGLPVTWTSLSPYLHLLSTTSVTGQGDSVRVTVGSSYETGTAMVEARVGDLADTVYLFIDTSTARRVRPPAGWPTPTVRRAPPLERPRVSPSMQEHQ